MDLVSAGLQTTLRQHFKHNLSFMGSFLVGHTARCQVINEGCHVIVQGVFSNGLIDDCLKVRRSIPWAKRQYQPYDQIFLGVTAKLLDASWFHWDLPETREQIYDRPNAKVANLENHIADVRDREAAAFRTQVQGAKINHETELLTSGLRDGETR
jgi:hypothetical protein